MNRLAYIASIAAAFILVTTLVVFAGPTRYHEYNNVVGPDSSHSYYVDVVGNGYTTSIYLYGDCNSQVQDIDLWVYEGNRLLAKATDFSCDHELYISTYDGRRGTLRVVVENEQKPYATGYTLIIE